MNLHHSALLANIGDLLQGLLPIIVAVLYGIAHLVGAMQQEKRKAAAKPRPKPQDFGTNPQRERKPAAAAGNQPTLEETLRREVEEFLRRSQGQPAQQAGNQGRPSQRTPQAAPRQRPSAPSRPAKQAEGRLKPQDQPRRLVDTPRLESPRSLSSSPGEPLRQTIAPTSLGAGVTAYVSEQMRGTQQLVQHAQTLGSDVAQADERLQQRLQQKFVHSIGTLTPLTTTAVEHRPTGNSAAQELRALLARPGGIRQVIIASEILRRPEERWDH
jgi:hypothetical protein